MKHWGIYNKETNEWWVTAGGEIFNTESQAVAEIMLSQVFGYNAACVGDFEVKAFSEDSEDLRFDTVYGIYVESGWLLDVAGKPVLFRSGAAATNALRLMITDDSRLSEAVIEPCEIRYY